MGRVKKIVINRTVLRQALHTMGEHALARVSQKARVSISLLQKLCSGGYNHSIKEATALRIANAVGLPLEILNSRDGK